MTDKKPDRLSRFSIPDEPGWLKFYDKDGKPLTEEELERRKAAKEKKDE